MGNHGYNGADWGIPDALTPGEPNSGDTCTIYYYTISEVQEDNVDGTPLHAGEFVHIVGIANIDNYILDPATSNFYIQDDDAGVNIFGAAGAASVVAGDCVMVEGWISHYNGLCEILSSGSGNCIWELDIVDQVDVPEPLTVTCNTIATLGEEYEGMLVMIEGVSITGGDPWPIGGEDANIDISDGTGTCIMRIDKDTNIDGQAQPPEPFDLVGIVNQYDRDAPYDEGYQVLPRDYSDFFSATDELTGAIPASFKFLGSYPNPFNASTRISFTVGHRSDVSLHIYDLTGREVTSTTISASSPGEYSYIWNGTNFAGKAVSTGLYLVRLDAGTESAFGKLVFLK